MARRSLVASAVIGAIPMAILAFGPGVFVLLVRRAEDKRIARG